MDPSNVGGVPSNLTDLFRDSERIAVLAGAGISIDSPSRLLDGGSFMREVLNHARPPEVSEEWATALLGRPGGLSRPGEFLRFEIMMKALADSGLDPSLTVLDLLDHCDRPNANHYVLAGLIRSGAVVMTTNFDRLIELAYEKLNPGDWAPLRVALEDEDFPEKLTHDTVPTLWKLHGSLSRNGISTRESVRATVTSILSGDAYRPGLAFLRSVLSELDLLVVGYSGWDDLDIMPILADTKSSQRLVWVDHDGSVSHPQIATAESMVKEYDLIWPRDVVGRDRLWHIHDADLQTLRNPASLYRVTAPTRAVLDSLSMAFDLPRAPSLDPDPGPFDRAAYFGKWKKSFTAARSMPYAFFLNLTSQRAFRAEVAKHRELWGRRLHSFRSAPEATPTERLALLFGQAGDVLCTISHSEVSDRESWARAAELEGKLSEARRTLEPREAATALSLLARFAFVRGDADQGEALFTEALDLAEEERDLPAQLAVIEGFLAARQWAAWHGIHRTPRLPFVEDPRVSYEHLEELRLRLGHQPARWQEDVAGGIAEVDDFGWQVGRLHRILRHAVDVGDVVTEARAGEKLGRIYYFRALQLGWSLPDKGWLKKRELSNSTEKEMVYYLVLGMEELVRVQELGRLVNLDAILEEPGDLVSRIDSCKQRLGPRFNPELLTKLRESMWRHS